MTDYNDEIALLIPAYLRGELSPEDMAKVEAAAAVDPSIKADLSFQKNLRETLQSDQPSLHSTELDWARFSKRLDDLEGAESSPLKDLPVVANDRPVKHSRFWMGATAAMALLALGQFGLLHQRNTIDDSGAKYTLVEETISGSQTTVSIAKDVRVDTLGSKLRTLKGQIVSGPSALGLFDLQFETQADCESALPELRDIMETVSNCR